MNEEEMLLAEVRKHRDGILQKELRKTLGMNPKTFSSILRKLESEGKIRRIRENKDFRITLSIDTRFSSLLSNGLIAPCVGCTRECEPEKCQLMEEWIRSLIR